MKPSTVAGLILIALALIAVGSSSAATDSAGPAAGGAVYLPLLSCPGCASSPSPSPGSYPSDLESEVVRLVNIERVKVGCPAATAAPGLMAAARAWSQYMADNDYYHHATADWYTPYGYPSGVIENIGGGGPYPEIIVQAWMASSAHRRNMLWCEETKPATPEYTPGTTYDIGVGYVEGYWTLSVGIRLP